MIAKHPSSRAFHRSTRRRASFVSLAWTALFLLLATGCRYPATEVLVVIGSDAPADRVFTISATFAGNGSSQSVSRVWVRGAGIPGSIELPASFAITPHAPGSQDAIDLLIHATLAPGSRGEPTVTLDRVARFRLTTRQTGVVRIYLPMACGNHATGCTTVNDTQCTVSVRCAERNQTCGDRGECISPDLTPEPAPGGDAGGLAFDVVTDMPGAVDTPVVTDALDVTDTACGADQIMCSGACVMRNDPAHCGTCTNACTAPPNATPTCLLAACDFSCLAGFHRCGAVCAADNDPATCGSACVPCSALPNATPGCVASACTSTCTTGFGDCDGNPANGCETNLNSSPGNCAHCGTVCPGGASAACVSGTCVMTPCTAGRGECDGSLTTVCETDLTNDVANCGACGRTCSFAHAAASCASGVCAMGTCTAGYSNCNGTASDGCEVDIANDASHCGSCTTICTVANGTPNCTAGVCGIASCNPGYHLCGTTCVANTSAGSCGPSCVPCPAPLNATVTCDGVSCGFMCNAGYMPSGSTCVTAMTCGDGILEGTETCDDGNTTPGDGCFSNCHIESDPADACPGTVLLTTGLFRGYTNGLTSNFTFACGAAGPDVVYQYYPPVSGTIRITLTPDVGWDAILATGSSCAGPYLTCGSTGSLGTPSVASFGVSTSVVYIVVGSNAGAGGFTLHIEYI